MSMSLLLIVFTRYPQRGAVKTRLIPALGPEGAAALHKQMAERVVARAGGFGRSSGYEVSLQVRLEGAGPEKGAAWLGDLDIRPQGPGDLGRRMASALSEAHRRGFQEAVLVGSDIPKLSCRHFAAARQALCTAPVVLGPARDGGYYLIGTHRDAWRQGVDGLFRDMPWSTAEVFEETLARADSLGLTVHGLPVLADVDRPEDLVDL